MKIKLEGDIIGLDVGDARTGVARISTFARISEPLAPIVNIEDQLADIVQSYEASAVVVGLPRNLSGDDTEQTNKVRNVISAMRKYLEVPVFTIDEAGTTKEAEKRANPNQSIDSVAACIILEDFIREVEKGNVENVIF